jgi:large subunit ribosomal protein L13
VVINAAQIQVTGNKLADKKYYRHSGFPGGLTEISLEDQLAKHPTRVIEHAVRGMLPKNRLLDPRMKRLKVYATAEHPHAPQSPKPLGV